MELQPWIGWSKSKREVSRLLPLLLPAFGQGWSSNFLNTDLILFLQIVANLKNPSSAATIIQFAQTNGLNVASGEELNYWLTATHDSLSSVDIFMLTNPLTKTEQHEDIAMSSFYNFYKNKNTFNSWWIFIW